MPNTATRPTGTDTELGTVTALDKPTIALHWLVGVTVMSLLMLGYYMTLTESYSFYWLHKSIGMTIFAVIIVRTYRRAKRGWLAPVAAYRPLERVLAKVNHWILVLATLVMPLSGIINSASNGHGLSLFGMQLVASNPAPGNPAEVVPYSEALAHWGHIVHELTGYLLAAAVVFHIAGALKHHIVDRDRTLKRMLGR